MRTVRLTIHTFGKYARYGKDVYKVPRGVELLVRNGWTPVRTPRPHCCSYSYLRAPKGNKTRSPVVEVDMPTDDEVRELAAALHAKGEAWKGDMCGWPASYRPERDRSSTWRTDMPGGLEKVETHRYHSPASFEVGELCLWRVFVAFEREERWIWDTENIVEDVMA